VPQALRKKATLIMVQRKLAWNWGWIAGEQWQTVPLCRRCGKDDLRGAFARGVVGT
jgi:hypothetical protein